MIIFKKLPDPKNPYEDTTVEFTLGSDRSLDYVVEAFKEFLMGVGYAPETVQSYFEREGEDE